MYIWALARLPPVLLRACIPDSSFRRSVVEALRNQADEYNLFPARVLERQRLVPDLISTAISRVGSVFILLFLVQLLISLYRYNVKLPGYYKARADALQLIGTADEKRLDTLVRTFSPHAIDFGRMPKTPIEHALLLAKEITALSKKG